MSKDEIKFIKVECEGENCDESHIFESQEIRTIDKILEKIYDWGIEMNHKHMIINRYCSDCKKCENDNDEEEAE